MRSRFIVALLVLWPAVAWSQVQSVNKARSVSKYDLDSTDFIACVYTGQDGNPWAAPRPGSGTTGTSGANIKTSGSSTTVTEVTSGALPFGLLAVGDQIFVNGNIRYITAKASGASITVDSAINIENGGNGYPFTWNKRSCGTGASDGWISVSGLSRYFLSFHLNQMNATSIEAKWECRNSTDDTNPVNVYPGTLTSGVCPGGTVASNACSYTAAGQNTRTDVLVENMPYESCRISMKISTDDGVDTGANAESITAFVAAAVPR